jgi:hypothetical protein
MKYFKNEARLEGDTKQREKNGFGHLLHVFGVLTLKRFVNEQKEKTAGRKRGASTRMSCYPSVLECFKAHQVLVGYWRSLGVTLAILKDFLTGWEK